MKFHLLVLLCTIEVRVLCAPRQDQESDDDFDLIVDDDPFDRPFGLSNLTDLGLEIIDGDIVVPINGFLNSSEADLSSFIRKGLDFDSFITGTRKWPDGIVSYWYNNDLTHRHRRVLQDAMKHWEDNTCLKFERAGSMQFGNYINYRSDRSGCFSMVGRTNTMFGQILNLGPGCVSRGTAVHELGHAIGFFHEQSRSDRDKYIKILWNNVKSQMSSQFALASDDARGVPYDYSSVMQYPEWAFQSDLEKNTIVTMDPFLQLNLGNTELTFRDRKTANAMYSCDEKCPNKETLKCENEGFFYQPHGVTEDCKCVCPPNTSGEFCETLLDRSYYDLPKCGGNITSEGPIETPNAPATVLSDGGCVFWIQAPPEKVPQVEFSLFGFQGRRINPRSPFSGSKCQREKVEIRTRDLYEGKMYCSNDLEYKNLTSETKDMIIIVAPKYSGYPGGFKATVRFVDESLAPTTEKAESSFLSNIFG